MVNRVTLVGRLTRDPEVLTSPKGVPVARLRLATNGFARDENNDKIDDVQYHSLVAFGGLATVCQEYLRRGKLIYVEGRLRSREWEGKDGIRRYTTEVNVDVMRMLSPKEEAVPDTPEGVAAGATA